LTNDAASVRPGWQSLMTIGMYTVNEGRLCRERRAIQARFTPDSRRTESEHLNDSRQNS